MIPSIFIASITALAGVTGVTGVEAADLPSQDPWYQVPSGIEHLAPGTILRHRQPPSPIRDFGVHPVNLKTAHQILYKTTDSFNASTATVLTVLVPQDAQFDKVLSYQVIDDSAFIDCAPSYFLQRGSSRGQIIGTTTDNQIELLLLASALARGWVVILPDYLGPKSAFLANKLSGQAILDGIRAATRSTDITGIHQSASVALWGYSGGSIASGWAAELHASYAPEVNIVGAALGGQVPSIPPVIKALNKRPKAGLLAAGLVGLANEYPEFRKVIEKHVLPQYRHYMEEVRTQCLVADLAQFLFKDVLAMLDDPTVLEKGVVLEVFKENALGKTVPKAPLYMYKPVHDEISPVADTDQLVSFYCGHGGTVQYMRDEVSIHETLFVTGALPAFVWLVDVLEKNKVFSGCTTKNVISTLLDPRVAKIVPWNILQGLVRLAGK